MRKKRSITTGSTARRSGGLKDVFPSLQNSDLPAALDSLQKQAEKFSAAYQDKISELDGAQLLKAFHDYEAFAQSADALKALLALDEMGAPDNTSRKQMENRQKHQQAVRASLFFKSEMAALPEYDLLDRMAEEPKLAAYTPWLRLHRSYRGKIRDTDSEHYIHDQMHSHPDLKRLWAKLAAPVNDNAPPLLTALAAEEDTEKRKKIFADFAQEKDSDGEILLQLLTNRLRATEAAAQIRGFDTPEAALTATSQCPAGLPEEMRKTLAPALPQLTAKFYKRKARRNKSARLHPADALHPAAPTIAADAWEKTVRPALEKFLPPQKNGRIAIETAETATDLRGQAGENPLLPLRLFPVSGTEDTLAVIGNPSTDVQRMIFSAHALALDTQQRMAAQNNTPLTAETLPLFTHAAGFAAEWAALDALIDAAKTDEARRDLMEFQLERGLQMLALSAAALEFDRDLREFAAENGSFTESDAAKIWKTALQNAFGSAIDYDVKGTEMLWAETPHMLTDAAEALRDMAGICLGAKIHDAYKNQKDGRKFAPQKFAAQFAEYLGAGGKKQGRALLKTLDIEISGGTVWQEALKIFEARFETLDALDKKIEAQNAPSPKQKKGGRTP
ncbi:MAG: hypothetical protein EA357_01640 [Micavibrio sp.]|nr:MAG: hypothetical protein EA357_01640 [Micavibrio sp.]